MIANILNNLQKVKRTGNGSYMACCPAHQDKSPSLTIKQVEGTILLHCFGGCDTESVLGAIGLTFDDLYPKDSNHVRPAYEAFTFKDRLEAIETQSIIVAMAASHIGRREKLTKEQKDSLIKASGLIVDAKNFGREQKRGIKPASFADYPDYLNNKDSEVAF